MTDEKMPCYCFSAFWLISGEEQDMSGYQDLELWLSKYEKYLDSLWGLYCMPDRTGTHNIKGLGPAIVLSYWWAIVMSLMLIMCEHFLNIVLNPSETEQLFINAGIFCGDTVSTFLLSCPQGLGSIFNNV